VNNKPEVSPSQWIKIGKKHAVVCNVHKDHIEVVTVVNGRSSALDLAVATRTSIPASTSTYQFCVAVHTPTQLSEIPG